MKININRAILILLLIGTFGIIFGFSNQDGEQSAGISTKITRMFLENSKKYQESNENDKEIIFKRTQKIIRKLAHFSIYTLVGFLLMLLFVTFNQLTNKKRAIISTIIGIIYASSDEIHQKFIAGRSAQITDVYIDTLGVILGILLVVFIIKVYEKAKNYYKQKDNEKVES